VDVAACPGLVELVQVGLASLPRLVGNRVVRGSGRKVRVPEVPEDEIESGQALLAVHKLPRSVLTALHHHRLQVIGIRVAFPNVVEELTDLVLRPPEASLIRGDEEVPTDITDRER